MSDLVRIALISFLSSALMLGAVLVGAALLRRLDGLADRIRALETALASLRLGRGESPRGRSRQTK